MIDVVALDGDDTLWHSENQFVMTQDRFKALLAGHADPAELDARLMAHERENLQVFGYGVKGFTLSMIETAIEVTEGRIDTADIQAIIDGAKEMLQHPVELLDGVADTVAGPRQGPPGDGHHQGRPLPPGVARWPAPAWPRTSGRSRSWPRRTRPPTSASSTATASTRRPSSWSATR